MCYERTNQLEAALREYQEAARLAAKNPAIFFAMGQLAMRLKQFPLVEHAFVQILFIHPGITRRAFCSARYMSKKTNWKRPFVSVVMLPDLHTNPAVQQMYRRLHTRLER